MEATIQLPSGSEFQIEFELWDAIVPSQSKVTVMSTKVEIEMEKKQQIKWAKLESDGLGPAVLPVQPINDVRAIGTPSPLPQPRAAAPVHGSSQIA